MCNACGRCKWLLQKLPFPPQQQIQWVNKHVISWEMSFHDRGSLAKLLHVWIFSRTRQLLHFSIRARQIRHLRMLLVRNTKTSLAGDFWSPYTNCTWCFPKPIQAMHSSPGRHRKVRNARHPAGSVQVVKMCQSLRTHAGFYALQGISAVSSTRISAPSPIPHFHHFQNKSGAFWFKQGSAKTMRKK